MLHFPFVGQGFLSLSCVQQTTTLLIEKLVLPLILEDIAKLYVPPTLPVKKLRGARQFKVPRSTTI